VSIYTDASEWQSHSELPDIAIPSHRTEPFRTTGHSHSEIPDIAIPNHRTEPFRTTGQSHSKLPDIAIPNHRTEPFRTIGQSHSELPDRAIRNYWTTYVSYQLTCYPDVILNHCLWVAPADVRNGFDKDGQTATPCYGACDDRQRWGSSGNGHTHEYWNIVHVRSRAARLIVASLMIRFLASRRNTRHADVTTDVSTYLTKNKYFSTLNGRNMSHATDRRFQ